MHVPFSKYRHYSTTKQYLPMNHYRSPVKCDTNPISECPVTHPPRFQGVTTLLASSFLHHVRELYLDIISGIDLSKLNTSHYTFCEYFTLHILWILHTTHFVRGGPRERLPPVLGATRGLITQLYIIPDTRAQVHVCVVTKNSNNTHNNVL